MDLQFFDFHGLSDSERCHLTNILQSDTNTEALKLPWAPVEKNNDVTIVIPIEVHNSWYNAMVHPYQQVMCNDNVWPATVYNLANGHIPQILPGMTYPHPEYTLGTEIQETNYNKDSGRRSNRTKNRKDTYNRNLNPAGEIQPGYMGEQEQYHQQIPIMYIYPDHPVPAQHSVAGPIYYSPTIYPPTTLQPHTGAHQYPQTYLMQHQRSENKFLPQSHTGPLQQHEGDTRPPTTDNTCTLFSRNQLADQSNSKPLQTDAINVNDSATKPRVKKKNTANRETVTSNGEIPPVDNMVEQNLKSSLHEYPKIIEENKSSLVNTNANDNIETKQNGEMGQKDKDENLFTSQTTVVSETISRTSQIELQIDENNTPTNDKDKTVIQTLNGSSTAPCVPSSTPISGTQSTTTRSWASLLKNNSADVKTPSTTTTHNNQNGLPKAVQKESTDVTKESTDATKESTDATKESIDATKAASPTPNTVNDDKTLQNGVLENFYDDPNLFRMGEFLLHYKMDRQTVSLLPRGLTNRSNYCYINSILQALLACPLFYNLLTALPHPNNHGKHNKHSTTPLIDNMVRFVREFMPLSETARLPRKDRAGKRGDDTVIESGFALEPSYVYTMLKYTSAAGVFSVEGRQEDAEEFLSCLLNGINDEMLDLMKLANNERNTVADMENSINHNCNEEEWKVIGPKNKGSITRCTELERTPLSDIFRGQLRSRVSRVGEQPTDNVQPFFTLQLDIEKAESVKHALEILVGKDQLEGMTCSKTKKQIEAWKQVTLEELPIILILHLKWFVYKFNVCSKMLKSVEFPVDLKIDNKFLSPNTAKKLSPKQKQYKLFAVTYHDGKEASKGHYVTDAFHVGYGGWVRYDDSSAKGISEASVLKPTSPRVPYLLYYRRCDTIGNNQSNKPR